MANRRSPESAKAAEPARSDAPARRSPRKTAPPPPPARTQVTPAARHAMIAERAYLRAERRGFAPGQETEDWLTAEAEIDALLKVEHGGSPQ